MPKKTVVGEFEGIKIVAENTWIGGAKLFVGDELVATNNNLLALKKNEAFMTTEAFISGQARLVEVFAYAVLFVKLKIKVDGETIAGDDF